MKTLARIGAVASFLFCSLGGLCILTPALSAPKSDGIMVAGIGLFFVGLGCFFGSILWVVGERHSADRGGK